MRIPNGNHSLTSGVAPPSQMNVNGDTATSTFEQPPTGGYVYDPVSGMYVGHKVVIEFHDDGPPHTFDWWWSEAPKPMPKAGSGTWV